MIRTVLTSQTNDLHLILPQEYVGKEIEVTYIILDKSKIKSSKNNIMEEFWGCLSDESAIDLKKEVQKSKNDWEKRLKKQF